MFVIVCDKFRGISKKCFQGKIINANGQKLPLMTDGHPKVFKSIKAVSNAQKKLIKDYSDLGEFEIVNYRKFQNGLWFKN